MKFTKLVSAIMLSGLLAACSPDNVKDNQSSMDKTSRAQIKQLMVLRPVALMVAAQKVARR